jgi:hypothetical protein
MEPAKRRPAPGPLSGAGSANFPAIAAAGTSPEGAASMCALNPGSAEMKAWPFLHVDASLGSVAGLAVLAHGLCFVLAGLRRGLGPQTGMRKVSLC